MARVHDLSDDARDYLRDTAFNLRSTLDWFNDQAVSMSSIETLLARVKHFADDLEKTADAQVIELRPTGTGA